MKTMYVNVRAIADVSGTDDESVAGLYAIAFNKNVKGAKAKRASIALDIFHSHVGIECLDNFEICVLDHKKRLVEEDDEHESYSGSDRGCAEWVAEPEYVEELDYGLNAEQLDCKYNPDGGGEHPRNTRKDWREAVANEDTISGYWEWIVSKIESRRTEGG